MSEKKINLEEILNSSYLKHKEVWGLTPIDNKYKNVAKDAMLEFGKQLLELAAENAKVLEDYSEYYSSDYISEPNEQHSISTDDDGMPYALYIYKVNKQSILDTLKQVE